MPDYALDDAGLTVPDWTTLQEGVLKEYQADPDAGGFGPTADVSPDSPFYKIASPVTRQVASVWQALRDLFAQFDPESAFGLQLDRLGSLIGLKRRGARRSTLTGKAAGTPATLVPAGARLRYLPTGSLWQVAADVVLPANGQAEVEVFALDFGPVDAPKAGPADWQIVTGQSLGWDTFESAGAAALGALRETDEEYRARFREAAAGLATYDAVVRALYDVLNVTRVFLFVNRALTYDPVLQLDGKQVRAIVQGGRKADIIAALHRSLGAPVDTAGSVEGEYDPGNGQILDYAYDRLTRRRCYLRLTITGGNPAAPLPVDAEERALAAVAATAPPPNLPFIPYVYGQAAATALQVAVPGCVTKMVAEGRLDPGDPWVEDAIPLAIAEVADVSTAPRPAEAVADAVDPVPILAGDEMDIEVDGGGVQTITWPVSTSTVVDAADVIADQIDDAVVDVVDGRLVIRTESEGGSSVIDLQGGAAASALFDDPVQVFEGADADVEIVLVP